MKTNTTRSNRAPRQLTRVITLLALVAAILATLMAVTPTAEAQQPHTVTLKASKDDCTKYDWKHTGGPRAVIDYPDRQSTTATLLDGPGIYYFSVRCDDGDPIPVVIPLIVIEIPHEIPFEPTIMFDPDICPDCFGPNTTTWELPGGLVRPSTAVDFERWRDLADEHRFAESVDIGQMAELAAEGRLGVLTLTLPNEEGFGAIAYSSEAVG